MGLSEAAQEHRGSVDREAQPTVGGRSRLDAEDGPEAAEDAAEYPILASIKEHLLESNVSVWGGGDNQNFDPARATTAIEQFSVDPVDNVRS